MIRDQKGGIQRLRASLKIVPKSVSMQGQRPLSPESDHHFISLEVLL